VQAGDDEVLRRMRRNYTANDYRRQIEGIRAIMPETTIATDIIVGFCGETDVEFAGTEALMRELRFDTVHLAAYSVRPGTAAARRLDDVPREEKRARLNHLLALQRQVALERNAAYVGHDVELLVEGIAADERPYGRTRENKVAWLPVGAAKVGDLQAARVTESSAWQLQVEPVGTAA
jgi:tRNA-2-methylthio-N6-dimethylallyladenosine synthase